jgi:hypothetical protein
MARCESTASSVGRIWEGRRTVSWYVHVKPKLILDPLHSALGLAVLSLDGQDGLAPFDAALCITKRAKDRLEKAPWRS